jgi:hypothetical protein
LQKENYLIVLKTFSWLHVKGNFIIMKCLSYLFFSFVDTLTSNNVLYGVMLGQIFQPAMSLQNLAISKFTFPFPIENTYLNNLADLSVYRCVWFHIMLKNEIIKEIKVLFLCFNLCLSVIVSRVHLHPCPFLQINVDFHLSTLKLWNLDYFCKTYFYCGWGAIVVMIIW